MQYLQSRLNLQEAGALMLTNHGVQREMDRKEKECKCPGFTFLTNHVFSTLLFKTYDIWPIILSANSCTKASKAYVRIIVVPKTFLSSKMIHRPITQ